MALRAPDESEGLKVDPSNGIYVDMRGIMEVYYKPVFRFHDILV
jgi:hypothetical protein